MRALILAAGYGTRLRPHTEHIPKPLFPVAGQPLIDLSIRRLIDHGVTGIIINVHHLHHQITSFIRNQNYPIPVVTRYEKNILGTGGAIRNVSDFIGNQPFCVINSDILTDIDISAVLAFHRQHRHPATLVMHDYPIFNNVWIDNNENIIAFSDNDKNLSPKGCALAFTGIQILDPLIMDFIPEKQFVSSIDVYKEMIAKGHTVKAFMAKNHYWRDIGTPERFSQAVYETAAPAAFSNAFGAGDYGHLERTLLAGDGSDRRWYRIFSNSGSLILGDHGIHSDSQTAEVDSFIQIGAHLFKKNIPVPEIFFADAFSGQVYVQDLGDIHLQSTIQNMTDDKEVIRVYRQVIDRVLDMSLYGAQSFDPAWTCQTAEYDRQLILDKECRYFVDAFLNTYLESTVSYDDLEPEFYRLADLALENAVAGFMHRDLQSRNIMVFDNKIFFIDFQGARLGPIQYDLASLLTDPYVNLSDPVRKTLLDYGIEQLSGHMAVDKKKFITGYRYCAITRTLQALGAFGFLTKNKNKPFFEQFIPIALNNLLARIESPEMDRFPVLTETVEKALMVLNKNLSNN